MKILPQTPGIFENPLVPTDSNHFIFQVATSVSEWRRFHSLTLAATAQSSRRKL